MKENQDTEGEGREDQEAEGEHFQQEEGEKDKDVWWW